MTALGLIESKSADTRASRITRVELTDIELDYLCSVRDSGDAFLALWRIICDFDNTETIDPGLWSIPFRQAREILEGRADIGDMGGLWLNQGPCTH